MGLNLTAGQWDEEDESRNGLAGDLGAQIAAPRTPAAPPPIPAPDDVLPPEGMGAPSALPQGPGDAPMAPTGYAPPAPPPTIAPYSPAAPPPIPPSRTVTPAEAGNLRALDANAAAQAETLRQAGDIKRQEAEAQAINADANADASNSYLAERDKIAQESAKALAERQAQAAQDFQAFRDFGIKDPQAEKSFGGRMLAGIAIGLGAYSQGIQGGRNNAYDIIQKANADNIALQKAKQEKLLMVAERSGKGVEEARKQRDDAFRQLDLKHAAMLQNSADELKAQLARIGIPAAQIATNADVQKLEAESLKLREHTLRSIANDETALARADIHAAAKRAKAAAAGGGGGASADAMAKLSAYAEQNPGDNAGLFKLASELGVGRKDIDKVNSVIKWSRGTESNAKDAGQGAIALRAVDAIEKSDYKPSRDDVNRWIKNQREVARAEAAGKGTGIGGFLGSGAASLAQRKGLLAQTEYDGLSDKARDYFTNVRRYMETVGRVQSGAAINEGEWRNFYGQYGPQASGGLEAARQFARDKFRGSGVAGRQLEAGGAVPTAAKGASDERIRLARQAIADPDAPAGVKARALQILRAAGAQ